MDTQTLLNNVTQMTSGDALRRKTFPLYDTVQIATGTTIYNPFKAVNANGLFQQNQVFPLSGSQIFAITDMGIELETPINTTTLYAALLPLLQQSYMEIIISDRSVYKAPLLELMSFFYSGSLGVTPAITLGNNRLLYRRRLLNFPIMLVQQTNVLFNIVIPTATATAFNGINLNVSLGGVMSDVLDPAFNYNPITGNNFQELDYTFFQTFQLTTANQNTYNLLTGSIPTNLFSQTFPLPNDARFEIQSYEFFFPGLTATPDFLNGLFASRVHNYFQVKVNDVQYLNTNLADCISLGACQAVAFNDNAGTPVTTNEVVMDFMYQQKQLELPLILPATGNVVFNLTQPATSPSVNNYCTAMFRGRYLRQVA